MAVFEDGLAGLTTTIGTGAYLVGGNVAGYREISQLADGEARVFVVRTATDFEIGLLTKSGGSTPSLARTAIYRTRSGGTTAVNWPVGEKTIHSTVSATVLSASNDASVRTADIVMKQQAILFDADDDTGIYSDLDDNLVFKVNNTETVRISGSNPPRLTLKWVDSGPGQGPALEIHRQSSSPLSNDLTGSLWWTGINTSGASLIYSQCNSYIDDPTPGSEDGGLIFYLKRDGVDKEALRIAKNGLRIHPVIQDPAVACLVGKSFTDANVIGCELTTAGTGMFTSTVNTCLFLNRKGGTGTQGFISLLRDGVTVAQVTADASGNVSWGTFIWHHPATMAGGELGELALGTVMVTIDEQFEPQGRSHLPNVAVSQHRGDPRVHGCFAGVAENGRELIINAGGAWQALVKGPVVGGDLLWTSDTAGVAEKQPDDIKRAATLGKVTMSDNRDQVRLVPCILEAG